MTIKTWQQRMVGNFYIADLHTRRTAQIALMQNEINDLRAYLPADSGMWRDVAQEWEKKYETLLQSAPASAWISVDEHMPSEGQNVTILYWPFGNHKNEQQAGVAQHCNGNFYTEDGDERYFPSHWMPMPIPPGEQK